MPFELKIALIGLAGAAFVLGPLIGYLAMRGPASDELEGSVSQQSVAEVTRKDKPFGDLRRRPAIYVKLKNREWKFAHPPADVYAMAKVGKPIVIHYRIGKSGVVYIHRAEAVTPKSGRPEFNFSGAID